MASELGTDVPGTFFGWGVGGADKMPLVVELLKDLGYERVVGVLDGNRSRTADSLQAANPDYTFLAISTDDVRTKRARAASPQVEGLADSGGTIRPENREEVETLFRSIAGVLMPDGDSAIS
jgi:hypothetical protein